MLDRQQFTETILPNGIKVYAFQHDFPITCLELILPAGAGHAKRSFVPGSPHFLEHAMLIRSKAFPEAYELDRALGLKGGHSNGLTYPCTTHYEMDVPASETPFAYRSLVDRVFNPVFHEEDLVTERTVVINERNQRKFYPGKSRASQYYYSQFLRDVFYPLNQIFGTDDDLHAMSADVLQAMHSKMARSNQITALVVGSQDTSELNELLSAQPTEPTEFLKDITPTGWKNREFHQVYFDTVSQPTLEIAWIHPRMSYEEFRAVSFIISLLINTTHGALYQEFREEKGWTYGLDGFATHREYNTLFGLTFPVNTVDQVGYIRACIHERIRTAVRNQRLVDDEISRYLCNQVYNYQTAGDIISSASYDLMTYGRIHTEQEWQDAVNRMSDPTWRETILTKYFNPEEMGEACFMPERRRQVFARESAPVSKKTELAQAQ